MITLFSIVLLTFCIAGLFHGLTGIGVTLIATTALASFYPMPHVLVLTVIPCLIVNLIVFLDGGQILYYLKQYWLLLLTSFLGSYIGTQLIFIIAGHHLLIALGLLIIMYVILQYIAMTLGRHITVPHNTPSLVISGTLAGLLGGSTNAMSPLLIMYLLSATEQCADPKTELIKASNLCYVVGKIAQLIVLWQSLMVLPQAEQGLIVIVSLFSVICLYVGFHFRAKISQAMFKKIVLIILLILGIQALIKGLWI